MNGCLVTTAIDRLPAVALAEVVRDAALLDRRERKYVLRRADLDVVLTALTDVGDATRILEIDGRRSFGYRSVYLDTPDLTSYLAAAHRRPRRAKVRLRAYLDTGGRYLEVKRRDRDGRTRKERLRLDGPEVTPLRDGWAFLDRFEETRPIQADLRPTLTTTYRRVTLLPGGDPSRVTVDLDLRCSDPDGRELWLPGLALVEVKSPARATTFDRLLWEHGHRPATVSKYGTGLAALRPELPSNRWHRALQHWHAAATPPGASWDAALPSSEVPGRLPAFPEPAMSHHVHAAVLPDRSEDRP